jgi:hypothetical protein
MWLFVPLLGEVGSSGATFSDFNNPSFPKTTLSVGAIKNIKVWSDGDPENPMISGYSITTSNTSGVKATFSYTSGSSQITKAERDFLEEDAYVRSLDISLRRPFGEPGGKYFIGFMAFNMTKGPSVYVGNSRGDSGSKLFVIPKGWRFAGLYGSGATQDIYEGYTGHYRRPINSIGIILAGLETID